MTAAADRDTHVSAREFQEIWDRVLAWGRWGPDDQRGALNEITPARVAAAAASVRSGRTVSLALDLNLVAGPDNPKPAQHFMTILPDADILGGEMRAACDYVGLEMHGDSQSHIDALCHMSYRGQLYNGIPMEVTTSMGATRLAMNVARDGIVGRGVLIDIPRLRGEPWVEPGGLVMADELEAAERAQGIAVGPGDIVLLRTGHHRRRLDLGPWDAAVSKAGLHPRAMLWLAERRIGGFGADGDGDCVPSTTEGVPYPIHALGMAAMGLWFMDSLQFEDLVVACTEEGRWDFLCVIAPLRLAKGTGSPVNPIAIF